MLHFNQDPHDNDGNDGYIWSRRVVKFFSLVVALVGFGGAFIEGGFMGFGQ